jgi:hypothetical protein
MMIQRLLAGYICDETFILNDWHHLCFKRQGMVLIAVTNLVLHQVGVQNQIRKTQTRLQLLQPGRLYWTFSMRATSL